MPTVPLSLSGPGFSIPLVQRPSVPFRAPLRSLKAERFVPPTDPSSPFRLPKTALRALCAAVSPYRSREAAFRLLSFLARFWTHPTRIDRSWPVDRRALADHRLLGLTEGEVRGALRVLEKAGVVTREPMERRHTFRPTEQGLRRAPILWKFAPSFLSMFRTANRWKALRDKRETVRGDGRSNPKLNNSYSSTPKVMFMGSGERASEKVATVDPSSPLEMALASLGKAILKT